MNLAESILLCRAIEATFPAQRLDEQTPDAWAEILADVPYLVAREAVREIAKQRTFIAACDIRHVSGRMRTLTRRAIRRAAREVGVLVNVDAEADRVITEGLARFDVDLLAVETTDERFYNPPAATLHGWSPALQLTGGR